MFLSITFHFSLEEDYQHLQCECNRKQDEVFMLSEEVESLKSQLAAASEEQDCIVEEVER